MLKLWKKIGWKVLIVGGALMGFIIAVHDFSFDYDPKKDSGLQVIFTLLTGTIVVLKGAELIRTFFEE